MAWTQSDLDAIDAAIKSGTTMVFVTHEIEFARQISNRI